MKCAHCWKEYTYESVKRRYGTEHYAEYGCCSEECYATKMSGAPSLPNPESNK